MSLADFWDETGGNFIGVGDHEVYIFAVKMGKTPTEKQTPFVEFTVKNMQGQERGVSIYTTRKSIWKLIKWVKACGLTREDARGYEPHDLAAHQGLINMRLMVRVEMEWKAKKGRAYPEVVDFWALNADAPPGSDAMVEPAQSDGQPEPEPPEGDEIQF